MYRRFFQITTAWSPFDVGLQSALGPNHLHSRAKSRMRQASDSSEQIRGSDATPE